MNILFVGLGSIGQRHLGNLKRILRNNKNNYFALKQTKKNKVIKDGKILKNKNIKNYYNINYIYELSDVTKVKPDISFICNPSSMHLDTAIKLSKLSKNIFIEKPLGSSDKKITKLLKNTKKYKNYIFIGLQTRFNPLIKRIKELIESSKFGEISYVNIDFLTYLPNHHKYENYQNSYASQRKLGGGALNCLIHEVDLINYLFGHPSKILSFEKISGILKVDADDYFSSKLIYKNKFDINLKLSLSEIYEKRSILIKFEKKTVICDLNRNILTSYNNKTGKKLKKKYSITRNDLFISEIKFFLNQINKRNKSSFLSIKDFISTQNLYFKLLGKKIIKF